MTATIPSLAALRPALRPEVVLGPALRDGGTVTHHLKDTTTGWYYKVGPREFFLASRLDGTRTLAEIGADYEAAFGRRLTDAHWQQLLGMLGRRLLLDGSATADGLARMADARRRQSRRDGTLLHRRIPLTDPDRLLGRLEPRLRFLFSPWLVVPLLVAVVALLAAVVADAGTVWEQVRAERSPLTWVVVSALLWLGLALHETAHGLTCKHFGGSAPEIGLLWRFPMVMPYCKADDVVLFRRRRHRVYTAFAGVFVNLVLLLPAGAVWLLAPDGSAAAGGAAALLVAGGVGAVANLVPFLQLDGYFMLSHGLGMANLRVSTYRYWAAVARAVLRRGPRPAYPAGERRAYQAYGIASFVFATGLLVLAVGWWFGRLDGPLGTAGAAAVLGAALVVFVLLGVRMARRSGLRGPAYSAVEE